MSERKRQKKDNESKNKNNRRMLLAGKDIDEKKPGRKSGRAGKVKVSHKIDSVRDGYGNQA